MTPTVTGVQLAGSPDPPLLVCGPSLGASVTSLWSSTAALLGTDFHVVGWDLPGHGRNRSPAPEGMTVADLADAVLVLVEGVQSERGDTGTPFVYAGDSVGGAVGQQLLVDHPDRITSAVLVCTAARIGEDTSWRERADLVRRAGTPVMVEPSARRWFAPGFVEAHPDVATALLGSLQDTDAAAYAGVCEALATFDLRDALPKVATPVVVVAGAYDEATPVAAAAALAHGVADGRLEVLDRVAHLAPAEAPAEMARIIREAAGVPAQTDDAAGTVAERRAAGMAVRRSVLGDAHVDRATAAVTDLTRDFQELITEYAWGSIWTRPGLDRRSRSMITLTALIARGHHEELAMHVRAARGNGLTDDEIKEVLLQSAIYCGVPDANTAFRVAQRTLADLDQEENQ